MYRRSRIPQLIPVAMLAGGLCGFALTAARAQTACAADRPCFNIQEQDCHDVVFGFRGSWDVYNVRYDTTGGETQVENKDGTWIIKNADPSTTYTIKVQGCTTHFAGSSTCTPWVEASYTTVGNFGPDTCQSGFVWREATPVDHVCVAPAFRTSTATETQQAASRREPGSDKCKSGFVWRGAVPDDHVCVAPDIRLAEQTENSFVNKRILCSQ